MRSEALVDNTVTVVMVSALSVSDVFADEARASADPATAALDADNCGDDALEDERCYSPLSTICYFSIAGTRLLAARQHLILSFLIFVRFLLRHTSN